MANKVVWKRNLGGAESELRVRGKVQAASTESFGMGEMLTYNETAGYWIGISAAADARKYLLGFAAEDINTLNTSAARYTDIIVPRPDDVFAIELASAAAIELGHCYYPTGTDPHTATLDADGYPILFSCGDANYPTIDELGGTSVGSTSYGLFTVNPEYSYYKVLAPQTGHYRKVRHITADETLKAEWTGMIVTNKGATGAVQVDLPQNCPIGTNFHFAVATAQALRAHTAGGGITIKGGVQSDSKYIEISDEGDFMELVCLGANDWLAIASISGADGDISVET